MDPATAAGRPRATGPARRQVLLRGLLGAGILTASPLLAGCGIELGDIRWDDGAPAPTPTPGPDELARRRAVASAQSLLAACTAARTVRPDLGAVLDLLIDQHGDHLVAFGVPPEPAPSGPGSSATSPTASPTASPSTAPTTTAPTAGSDPVGDLTAGHTAAASEAMTDAAGASGPLAMLLAQAAACRAVQARRLAAALGSDPPPDPAPARAPEPAATGAPTTERSPASGPSGTAAPTVEPTPSSEVTQALRAAVDGEHAAVYGYGVLAAKLTGAQRRQALADLGAHEDVAEQLSDVLDRAGLEVPPAAPAYRLDEPVTGAARAVALAVELESSLAALDAALVAASTGELRAVAVDLLLARALAAHRWGASPTAFPGRR